MRSLLHKNRTHTHTTIPGNHRLKLCLLGQHTTKNKPWHMLVLLIRDHNRKYCTAIYVYVAVPRQKWNIIPSCILLIPSPHSKCCIVTARSEYISPALNEEQHYSPWNIVVYSNYATGQYCFFYLILPHKVALQMNLSTYGTLSIVTIKFTFC